MKFCILMASPRPQGNTATILASFREELEEWGSSVDYISLYKKKIKPCIGCRVCQNIFDGFGCPQNDDMQSIFNQVLQSDCLVLATPIYSWYCTPPLKAALDRLVFGMNKYYGEKKGPSLWSKKKCALIVTCGYKVEYGADLFEQGMIRYCKHSQLDYLGMLAVRDKGKVTAEDISRAKEFARKLIPLTRCRVQE